MRLTRILFYLSFIFCLLAVAVPAAPAQALTGTIAVYPLSGPTGTLVNVTGSGFTGGSNFTIHFGAANLNTGTVNSGGNLVNAYFNVPIANRAAWSVTITTDAGDTSSSAVFNVVPQVILDYASGRAGDIIKVSGTGFAASATITIFLDSTAMTTSNSDPSGSFSSVQMTIPAITPGRHAITAGDGLVYSPEVALTILPKITYTPNVQTVGSQITISGSGFTANSPMAFLVDTLSVTSSASQTDANGSFSNTTLVIPPLAQGTHTLKAQDINSNVATANLYIRPGISLSPQNGTPGAAVTINGSGFAASQAITVTYNGAVITTNPSPINTDTNGSFTASFAVPAGGSGSYTVQATDGTNSASTTFIISASLSVNPASGLTGATLTLSGSNFSPSTTVTISYDAAQIATAVTDASGSFSTSFKAPVGRNGPHIITATDGTNSVTVNFSIQASITLSTPVGQVDSGVTVSGTGFAQGRGLTVTFDRIQAATTTTDGYGSFGATFKVPGLPSGGHQIAATDGVSMVTANFTVSSSASLSPVNGYVGTTITVKGAGLGSAKAVTVDYDKVQVATGATDVNGAFTATFATPNSATGNHQVGLTDGTSTASFTFTVTPAMGINPTSGNVGGNLAMKGVGFGAAKSVSVKYDNAQVAQSTTDASGTFSATFIIPPSTGGNHVISATDGTSTITTDFAMDSTPPPAPTLLQPADATKASAQASLSWSAVSDPSGVTYELQIAPDATFATILVDKKGLTNAGYTLSDQEKLKSASKDKPYYWRVKAIDGASNQSPWSTPKSFYVGFVLPQWATYVIFAVIAIVVGILGFWLGRKTYPY
ncbi:MAG: hypothetical protein Q7R57_04420 [Dehalococcoidales bacterium]|nr:hypothetical protein [Dehalococcoidales bacterium]